MVKTLLKKGINKAILSTAVASLTPEKQFVFKSGGETQVVTVGGLKNSVNKMVNDLADTGIKTGVSLAKGKAYIHTNKQR